MKGDSRPAQSDPPDGAKRLKGTAERRMRKAKSSGQCEHQPLPSRTLMAPVCGMGARASCPPNRASHREVSPCCGPVATPRKAGRMLALPNRRNGGGIIILRAGHFGVFAKRSQMMGASRFEKRRFPAEKRVFQCAGTAESKSLFYETKPNVVGCDRLLRRFGFGGFASNPPAQSPYPQNSPSQPRWSK